MCEISHYHIVKPPMLKASPHTWLSWLQMVHVCYKLDESRNIFLRMASCEKSCAHCF